MDEHVRKNSARLLGQIGVPFIANAYGTMMGRSISIVVLDDVSTILSPSLTLLSSTV